MSVKRKERIGLLVISLSLLLAATAAAVGVGGSETAAELPDADVRTLSEAAAPETAASSFVLREYEGFIAIFTSDFAKKPATVTDIEVKTLREADRELLRQGIPAATREEVMQLLEDLGS